MRAHKLQPLWQSLMAVSVATACLYNPTGPLRPREEALMCHPPIADNIASNATSPWDFHPRCLGPKVVHSNATHTITAPGRLTNYTTVYCIYTSTTFRDNHGTSIITTPEIAASLLADDNILAERPVSPAFQPRLLQPDAYKIVDIRGKGKGVVATRQIRKGEIFMVEYPALLIGTSFLRDSRAHHQRRLVRRAVEQLPEGTKKGVYDLYRKDVSYVVDDIMAVNAVSVPITEEEKGMGLFLDFSRINHDCQPNAVYRFSPKTLALEVFSYRTIQPGEEITVSYTPISMPRHDRRKYLKQVWGFDCSCHLCSSNDEAEISDSNHRRQRVGELRESIMQASSEQYFENALVIAHEWLQVAELEGIPPLLPEYYDIVARLSYDVGDLQEAKKYAQLALDGWTKFGSVDDTDLETAREYVRELNRLPRDTKLGRKGFPNIFKDS